MVDLVKLLEIRFQTENRVRSGLFEMRTEYKGKKNDMMVQSISFIIF